MNGSSRSVAVSVLLVGTNPNALSDPQSIIAGSEELAQQPASIHRIVFYSGSSQKMVSIFVLKSRAILNASGSDGSYLPVSIAFTDCRETSSLSASSCCDQFRSARSCRSRLFIDPSSTVRLKHLDTKLEEVKNPNGRGKRKEVAVAMKNECVVLKPLHRTADDQCPQKCPEDGLSEQVALELVLFLRHVSVVYRDQAEDQQHRQQDDGVGKYAFGGVGYRSICGSRNRRLCRRQGTPPDYMRDELLAFLA
jgi:hypothetical protein